MLKTKLRNVTYCDPKCPFKVLKFKGHKLVKHDCVLFNKRLILIKNFEYLTMPIC